MANEFNIKNGFKSNGNSTVSGKLTTQKLTITSGATNGYVLTSDASGNAVWQAASSVNIYNSNGTLSSDRTIQTNGQNLVVEDQVGTTNFNSLIQDTLGNYSTRNQKFDTISYEIQGSEYTQLQQTDTQIKLLVGDGIINKDITLTSGGVSINSEYTLPNTDGTSGQALTTDGLGVVSWSTISSSVPQTDIIYIDSTNGADNGDTNRGNVEKPYASVEYVLANVVNTGTVTGTTTSGSATISSVNDTSNIKVGQYITGTGIPFNTTVLSKTSNSITISTTATANGTVTLTWWTPKLLRLNGDFTATSNWFKQGFYFDSNPSVSVQWGAFNLYDVTTLAVIPYVNNSEFNYYGTTSSSRWFVSASNVQTSDTTISFKFTSVHSNTTNYLLSVGGSGAYYYGNYRFEGKILNAKLGYACSIGWSHQNVYFDIQYTYGLLGGVLYDYFQNSGIWKGSITTPASVYAINNGTPGGGNIVFSEGTITGSVYYSGKGGVIRVPFYSNIVGSTTCNLSAMIMYGNIPDNAILNGNVDLYGQHTSYLYCDAGYNRIYRVPTWGIVSRNSAVVEINSDMSPYNIQVQGTSKMIINAKVTPGSASIAAGSKLIVNGELNTAAISVSGELINNNDTILTSGSITINSGGKVRNYKKIESTVASTTVPLIVKDAGDLYLYPGSYLKVANTKGPLKCTANTSTSKNIYVFNSITNCDGSTYGLQIAFDGSSYAANDLVGGLLYENTSY